MNKRSSWNIYSVLFTDQDEMHVRFTNSIGLTIPDVSNNTSSPESCITRCPILLKMLLKGLVIDKHRMVRTQFLSNIYMFIAYVRLSLIISALTKVHR